MEKNGRAKDLDRTNLYFNIDRHICSCKTATIRRFMDLEIVNIVNCSIIRQTIQLNFMRISLIQGLLLAFLFIISCRPKQDDHLAGIEVENVDVTGFDQLRLEGKRVVIDVRTPKEIGKGKISNAVEIDVKSKNFLEEIKQLDKNKSYLVYCRSGKRGKKACQIMLSEGFSDVVNLEGGYNMWSKVSR